MNKFAELAAKIRTNLTTMHEEADILSREADETMTAFMGAAAPSLAMHIGVPEPITESATWMLLSVVYSWCDALPDWPLNRQPSLVAMALRGDGTVIAKSTRIAAPGFTATVAEAVSDLVLTGPRNVMALAVSLCHCRNVSVTTTEVARPLQKKRAQRGRAPVTRYHTLVIDPMRRTLDRSVHGSGDLKKALHICRGHFKEYREGAGLFGQHGGMWWWNMHARGNPALGRLVKDYAVIEPGAENLLPNSSSSSKLFSASRSTSGPAVPQSRRPSPTMP